MGNETIQVWDNAIQSLRQSKYSKIPGVSDPLPLLKFSYDYLKDKDPREKECFLHCALWPEDSRIRKEDLVVCWMGHGLLGEFGELTEAYNNGYAIIDSLQKACLLESVDVKNELKNEYVKLHDVIRDMALWILHDCGASEKKWVVVDEAWNPQGLVLLDETTWKVVQKMILIGSLTDLASNIQIAPNLTTVIMRISLACSIPKCFRYFHALKYLDISYNENFVFLFPDIDRFPMEICGLEKLEFLSISDSLIISIPEEIKNLRNLKYLLLPNNSLRNISGDTLANLSSLEVLNLYSTDHSYLGPNNRDYLDYCLKGRRLKAIGITVSSQNDFQQLAKLSAAGLSIRWLSIQGMKGLSTLPLFSPHFLGSQHVHSGLEQLAIGNAGWQALEEILIEEKHCLNVTYLKFRGIHLLKEITWKKGVDAKDVFANLRELHISYCFGLAHISWVAHLPRLELLDIVQCIKLKQLVKDDDELRVQEIEEEAFGHGVSFPRLRSLTLIEIDGLTNISQHPLTFPSLEWLKVAKCAELKKLPFHSPTSCSNLRKIIGSKSWWDNLEFDDEAMKTFLQPYFIGYT